MDLEAALHDDVTIEVLEEELLDVVGEVWIPDRWIPEGPLVTFYGFCHRCVVLLLANLAYGKHARQHRVAASLCHVGV